MLYLLLIFLAVPASTVVTFAWDCTKTPKACTNACFAVRCGKTSEVQTRAEDEDDDGFAGNRARSGCAASPCQSLDFLGLGRGFSCDEFPFASSVEGGYDAFLRCIPSNENKVQGGLIGGFYRQNSLKPNGQDKYKITVQNADKLRYCDDNVPGGCANDGQQFHTQWRLNKRGIEEQTPMLVPDVPGSDEGSSNVTMPAPLRKFVTAGGVELWLLARNITDDVVGEEVWLDWNRTHPDVIVQEITELAFDR